MIKKLALKLEDQNTFEMLISLNSVIYWAKSRFTHMEANFLRFHYKHGKGNKSWRRKSTNTTCKEIKKFDLGPVFQSPC